MSDSEDDYNSGDDGDYVPSGDDGSSDSDYDEKDGKNSTFVHCCKTDEDEEDDDAHSRHRKKSKRDRKKAKSVDCGKMKTLPDMLTKENENKLKEKSDKLWNDFLKDVGQLPNSTVKEPTVPKPSTVTACKGDMQDTSASANIIKKNNSETVTKIFDFAGETVEVKEQVSYSKSEDNSLKNTTYTVKPTTSSGLGGKRPHGGLGNLLNKITKKSKISTLEKSKLDWNSFKQKEGIEDDLKLHNKGKDGFLEKRDFLDRANQRQYEIEKTFRLELKKSTR